MRNVDLNLSGVSDENLRNNFQKLQDFLNGIQTSQNQLQACEIYVTGNVTGAKIEHRLGGVPTDVILSRLIAPSAARLKFRFADFTSTEVVYDVTGLSTDETLSARFLVGSFVDVVTSGSPVRTSVETQEFRSKY